MDDIGQFLFLLAFVIIAAIQWVVKQIQERNAPPEPKEDPFEDTWRELEDQREERGYQEESEAPQVRREQEPQTSPATNPLGELRNLFEALKQRETPVEVKAPPRLVQAPVVVAAPAPPPVSSQSERSVKETPEDRMSDLERAAFARVEARRISAQSPSERKGPNDGNFRKFLRGSGNLRQALILKEVFDRPLGLRHENQEESMRG